MTNKKGISIFKTILFIVLSVLFAILVIYVMSYINTKNKNVISSKSNLRLQDSIVYSPLDDISSFYVLAYKNSNFQNQSAYYTNALSFETNNNVYVWDDFQANYYQYSSGSLTPFPFSVSKNSNSILIGNDLNVAHSNIVDEGSYFNNGGVRSFAIAYNCDISIQYFNFTMYYNFPISSSFNIYFYVMTDVGSVRFTDFNFTSSTLSHNFVSSSILSSLPNANRVLRFGFGIAQSSSTSNITYYLPNSNGSSSNTNGINYVGSVYNTYYNSLNQTAKDNLCYISFAESPYPEDYQNGYDKGFSDGVNSQLNIINELNRQLSNLNNEINSMSSTITQQQNIIENLQLQLDGVNSNFKGFFFTLADIPFRTIGNVLGFDIFGVNLFQFFVGIITALGMIWLIKKFI